MDGDVVVDEDDGVCGRVAVELALELSSIAGRSGSLLVLLLSLLSLSLSFWPGSAELSLSDVLDLLKSDEERPVGESNESLLLEFIFSDVRALLIICPSCTCVVCAIWPQPCPCERSVRIPGKFEDELAEAIRVVLVEVAPAAASGPPISTDCHWSGVAQPVMPALRSASAASASVMYASP